MVGSKLNTTFSDFVVISSVYVVVIVVYAGVDAA